MSADKVLIRERFEANFKLYNKLALVQQQISERLALLCEAFCSCGEIKRLYEIGAGTGFLTSRIVGMYKDAKLYVNDISPASRQFTEKYTSDCDAEYLFGDAEHLQMPSGLDLIATASTIQWFDNVESFINRTTEAVNKGGYLAFSTFGPDNFREIKQVASEGLAYHDQKALAGFLADAGYRIQHEETYIEALEFDSPMAVLRHIKATGVNSIKKTHWSRSQLQQFEKDYSTYFTNANGNVTLTYNPIIFIAQRI